MKIPFIVIFTHCIVIAFLVYFQPSHFKKVPRRPVVVKTYLQKQESKAPKYLKLDKPISLLVEPPPEPVKQPEKKEEAPKPIPKPEPKPAAKAAPKPETKKVAPKPAAKVVPKPSTKPTVKKQPSKTNLNQQKLISMMQESLHTLNATGKSQAATSPKPSTKTIGKLASETLSFETNYEEELASYLESLLILPEKGKVKLKLTLNRQGSVQKIDILNATSDKNKNYIETMLSSRSFPSFGSQFKGETAHTFTIMLISEDYR